MSFDLNVKIEPLDESEMGCLDDLTENVVPCNGKETLEDEIKPNTCIETGTTDHNGELRVVKEEPSCDEGAVASTSQEMVVEVNPGDLDQCLMYCSDDEMTVYAEEDPNFSLDSAASSDLLFQNQHQLINPALFPETLITTNPNRPHVCDICNKAFMTVATLGKHKKLHSDLRAHECKECHRKFHRLDHLKKHMRSHTGFKPYFCSMCNKPFSRKETLNIHVNAVHKKQKPYICAICHKSFTQGGSLKEHMLIHTQGKPHSCELCGKAFNSMARVAKHVRIVHDKDKHKPCPLCDSSFATPARLNEHLRSHTGERPYTCDICGNKFIRDGHLKNHVRSVHKKERPKCKYCHRNCYDESSLRKHVIRSHKQERSEEEKEEQEALMSDAMRAQEVIAKQLAL